MDSDQLLLFLQEINNTRRCITTHCNGKLVPVSITSKGLGGALSFACICDGCKLKGETAHLKGNTNLISKAVQVAFILSGCTHATYLKTLKHTLGIDAVSPSAFINTIKTMYPVVKAMVDEQCQEEMEAMKCIDETMLGSFMRAVTTADGAWMQELHFQRPKLPYRCSAV